MPSYVVTRLSQNPLGAEAPVGQRGDIVRVSTGWATLYLDPDEFDKISEGQLERLLDQADRRPRSQRGTRTPAGGRSVPVHQADVTARVR